MRNCLKGFGEVCRINVDTGAKSILRSGNDLQCLDMHERFLDSYASVQLQLSMTNYYTWKCTDLFISWGIGDTGFDQSKSHVFINQSSELRCYPSKSNALSGHIQFTHTFMATYSN
jgi:hypothetical protein